jgi:hypothetical protein
VLSPALVKAGNTLWSESATGESAIDIAAGAMMPLACGAWLGGPANRQELARLMIGYTRPRIAVLYGRSTGRADLVARLPEFSLASQ